MYQLPLFCHKILHLRHLQHREHCGFHEPSGMMTMTTKAPYKTNLYVLRLQFFGWIPSAGVSKVSGKNNQEMESMVAVFLSLGCDFGCQEN
jgi:hypothetical protein